MQSAYPLHFNLVFAAHASMLEHGFQPDFPAAAALELAAIAADPAFADPHVQLAIAYERLGRSADAAAERAKATALAPSK